MSDSQESIRNRTSARMGLVAPPGMSVPESGLKRIGRYEIVRTLGKGAMGVVYKGRDPDLDRVVAVKTIVTPRGGSKRVHANYIERFKREARAAAKMQHPCIVTIYDIGFTENDVPFMVLEYLPDEETLADRLDRVRLPLKRVVDIALDLANALSFAHKQRIVHRDVKPANVLNAGEDRWKLTDFGIARLPDSDLTQVGIFMGTPGYSPPEAIRFGQYTYQADVFAWGAVLYEMLSGRIPYEGPDTRTTNGYVIKGMAKSPRYYDPSIPEPLAEVTMKALSISAEDRYKDGAAIEHALREAWNLCLNQHIVPTSALTGPEVPHSQVSGQMHNVSHAAAVGQSAAPPESRPQNQAAVAKEQRPEFAVSTPGSDISDDAPTQILIRAGTGARAVDMGVLSSSQVNPDADLGVPPETIGTYRPALNDLNAAEPSAEPVGNPAPQGGRKNTQVGVPQPSAHEPSSQMRMPPPQSAPGSMTQAPGAASNPAFVTGAGTGVQGAQQEPVPHSTSSIGPQAWRNIAIALAVMLAAVLALFVWMQ